MTMMWLIGLAGAAWAGPPAPITKLSNTTNADAIRSKRDIVDLLKLRATTTCRWPLPPPLMRVCCGSGVDLGAVYASRRSAQIKIVCVKYELSAGYLLDLFFFAYTGR